MGTGLNAQLGVAKEETYGTYKVPTKFFEVESIGLARKDDYLSSRPLRGRPGIPVARHKATTRQAEGPIALEIPNKGFGTLLNLLHGETVTPEKQGATSVYKQIHPLGVTGPNGKSLTIQANKPSVKESVPFSYTGSKITGATFSCDTSAQLKCSLDVMSRDALLTEALATASYPDPISSFDFTQCVVEIGGSAISAELIIHSFNLSIPIPVKSGRWGLGQGALQLEPIAFNDSMVPTVEFACEFSNKELYEKYVNGNAEKVVIKFVGPTIESTYKQTIGFILPKCKFIGSDPEVSGPDVLDQTASIEVYDAITEPLASIEYISVDSAI